MLYGGVTSRYFDTLNVPLLRGRNFTVAEGRTRSAVAIVNRRMADRLWPDEDALGRRFRLADGTDGVWHTVIGVSRDISNWDLSNRPLPTAYLPFPHVVARVPTVLIRALGDPALAAGPAREAVSAIDAALSVFDVQLMDDVHRLTFWRQRLFGQVFVVFGAIAVLLAATRVYEVLSYFVSQRTREIGLRIAIGAEHRDIVRLIVRQGMMMTAGGIGVGLVGAFAVTRVARRQLYEVSATDPVSFAGVALLLAVVGWFASYAPARRAAALDPSVLLRE
ncbi:MAG: hypothetical protein CL477_13770 [Acidobacteria bacterium]|nr:hypothetical protein [Acidobacteriota bacterium]